MKDQKTESSRIIVARPKYMVMKVPIIGVGSYIPERLDEKTVKRAQHILEKGEAPPPMKNRDLDAEYESKFYRDEDGAYAAPCAAFKAAMLQASVDFGKYKSLINRNVHVMGDFAPLEYKELRRRRDFVRQSGMTKAPDIRDRPEFVDWKTTITIRFDADLIPKEVVLNLIARAGFAVGIGGWRPASPRGTGGSHGTWEIGETNAA